MNPHIFIKFTELEMPLIPVFASSPSSQVAVKDTVIPSQPPKFTVELVSW